MSQSAWLAALKGIVAAATNRSPSKERRARPKGSYLGSPKGYVSPGTLGPGYQKEPVGRGRTRCRDPATRHVVAFGTSIPPRGSATPRERNNTPPQGRSHRSHSHEVRSGSPHITFRARSGSPTVQRLFEDAASRERKIRDVRAQEQRERRLGSVFRTGPNTDKFAQQRTVKDAETTFKSHSTNGEMSYSQFKDALMDLHLDHRRDAVDDAWALTVRGQPRPYVRAEDFVRVVTDMVRTPEAACARLSKASIQASEIFCLVSDHGSSLRQSTTSHQITAAELQRLSHKDTTRTDLLLQEKEESLTKLCTFNPKVNKAPSGAKIRPAERRDTDGTILPGYMSPRKESPHLSSTERSKAELQQCTFVPKINTSVPAMTIVKQKPYGYGNVVSRLRKGSKERKKRFEDTLRA